MDENIDLCFFISTDIVKLLFLRKKQFIVLSNKINIYIKSRLNSFDCSVSIRMAMELFTTKHIIKYFDVTPYRFRVFI